MIAYYSNEQGELACSISPEIVYNDLEIYINRNETDNKCLKIEKVLKRIKTHHTMERKIESVYSL